MDDETRGSRGSWKASRVRRVGGLGAALAGLALLVAACSGGNNSGSATAGDTTYQKAVAFAQCMRSHGEPSFADPDSHGTFTFHGNPFTGPAYKACHHLLPDGSQVTLAQQQRVQAQALKFAACVRFHGVPNFPDPTVNAQRIVYSPPPGERPSQFISSPKFQSAQRACQKLKPGP